MENAFSFDFAAVRVHTGAAAHNAASALGARALTTGTDVLFRADEYQPGTQGGDRLLAHELAHVVQQAHGLPQGILDTGATDHLEKAAGLSADHASPAGEREARGAAKIAAMGEPVPALSGQPPTVAGNRAVSRLLHGVQTVQRFGPAAQTAGPTAPKALTAAQLAKAQAAMTDLSDNALEQLQRALGVLASGAYNKVTANAVYARQQSFGGAIPHPGVADSAFFSQLGLIRTTSFAAAPLAAGVDSTKLAKHLSATFPRGVRVAVYSDYDLAPIKPGMSDEKKKKAIRENANAREFNRQAETFAKGQGAVGLRGGAIRQGEPVAVKSAADVIEKVQAIHLGLLAAWKASAAPGDANPPAWTSVETVATFCHGIHWGLDISTTQEKGYVTKGLHSIDRTAHGKVFKDNLASFASGVSGAVSADVKFLLFACSTAGSEGFEHYMGPTGSDTSAAKELGKEETTGKGSLASRLQQELATATGGSPSVYGHLTAGHTTRNPAAKIYGRDAGGVSGGALMFDRIYDTSYINNVAATLWAENLSSDQLAQLTGWLRVRIFEHFVEQIRTDTDKGWKGKGGKPIAQEMFADIDTARTLLQKDMTAWIATHLKGIAPLPAGAA